MRIEPVTTDERCACCGAAAQFRLYYGRGNWGAAFCRDETLAKVYAQLLTIHAFSVALASPFDTLGIIPQIHTQACTGHGGE